MFIHSNKKYTERSMYLIDPYRIKPPVSLGFEAFVAPANFDRTAQPVNIYEVFKAYYPNNQTAKYIYSFSDAYNTLTLSAGTGISYRYGYTRAGVDYVFDVNSVVNPFSATTDTKRWIIVKDASSSTVSAVLPIGAVWAYCADVNSVSSNYIGNYLKYIHLSKLTSLTTLQPGGFYSSAITGIVNIPSSVTEIPTDAFRNCKNITSIPIHSFITSIGDTAFIACDNLTGALVIYASVNFIGANTFNNCNFSSITSSSANYPASDNVLYDIKTVGQVVAIASAKAYIGTLTLRADTTSIYGSCFQNNQRIGDLTIPSLVTIINDYAFLGCVGFISLSLPGSLMSIYPYTFSNCNFSSITSSSANYPVSDNVLYDIKTVGQVKAIYGAKNYVATLTLRSDTTIILDSCFSGNKRTGALAIPNTVKSIGSNAFAGCTGITSFVMPNSLTSLGSYAFNACYGLTSVTIGAGITSILEWTFGNCVSMTSVVIPSSIISIGVAAFYNCNKLTTINLPANVATLVSSAFERCEGVTLVNCYRQTAPMIQSNALKLNGVARPLHIPVTNSGYNVSPWTDTAIFSSIIADL